MSHSSLKLCAVAAVLLTSACATATLHAQSPQQDNSVHPITSLPKAPDDPSNTQTHPPANPAAVPPSPETAPAPATPVSAPPPSTSSAPAAEVAPPTPVAAPEPALQASLAAPASPAPRLQRRSVHLFSTVAVEATVGAGGFGAQLATPLAQAFNLRVGGDAFGYSQNLTENGLHFTGDLKFRSANVNLDWFPFHGAFRISPGLTLYNGNNLNASVSAPGGQSFELADTTYTSLASDPVHGTASLTFGKRIAPQLTAGFGNMIPRSGRHFSVPFEIGFEYIGAPTVIYNLQGTACSGSGPLQACANVATDPTIQSNVLQEQNELNADIYGLRFFPIVRLGVSYKF